MQYFTKSIKIDPKKSMNSIVTSGRSSVHAPFVAILYCVLLVLRYIVQSPTMKLGITTNVRGVCRRIDQSVLATPKFTPKPPTHPSAAGSPHRVATARDVVVTSHGGSGASVSMRRHSDLPCCPSLQSLLSFPLLFYFFILYEEPSPCNCVN